MAEDMKAYGLSEPTSTTDAKSRQDAQTSEGGLKGVVDKVQLKPWWWHRVPAESMQFV